MLFETAGIGMTMAGPSGKLIPLGIENVVTNPILVTEYYNWFALIGIFILTIMASQRDSRFMAFLLPIWGGTCLLAGWLTFPNPAAGYGILVVLAIIAVINYMQEVRHERFGIAGPGNIIVKLFFFMIILQCVVVFVNSAAIFPPDTQPLAQSNNQYSNIDLQQNVGSINNSGGLYGQIVDIATQTMQMAVATLYLLGACMVSIGAFSIILAAIFPWITQAGVAGAAILVVLQFAIWSLYVLFWFTMTYRPSPDPGF